MNSHLFLNSVLRPARYVAGEYNLRPTKPDAAVKWCFAFPDVYEVGMSFTGMNVLYGLLNTLEESSCERVFAPWVDAEARLSDLGQKLRSLETGRALEDFDVLGISLQHEMNYSNVLTLLNSGGLPLWQKERDRRHPIVIGGGACVYNSEPMADFFDAFVIGDGEEVVHDINQRLVSLPPHRSDRDELLHQLALIPGVYVPSLYEVRYHPDGTVAGFDPRYEDLPFPVQARKVRLRDAYFNLNPMVPSSETIHDRAAIEVLRGCTRGCRFCQAGYITRPIRERPAEEIVRLAKEVMKNTGYDNLSLLSLSTADHKNLPGIVDGLMEDWDPAIGISLPSLRIDGFDMRVATRLAELHQTGFTFAPEAGTTRLRKAISKDLGEKEIFATLDGVFQRGWQTIKLYFQLGLPTETYDDLDGMADLVRRVRDMLVRKVPKRPQLNVSANPHVPKPFTPFQWFSQDDLPTLQEKARYLKRIMPRGPVNFKYHEPRLSVLEGVMARGDRKVATAIHRAWELGCRFDDWSETFRYDIWMQAFEETGIDPAFYNQRERGEHEIFPWELVSCGVERSYFWLEWNRALKHKATYDCRDRRNCTICGICSEDYRHDLYRPEDLELGPSLVDLVRKRAEDEPEDGGLCGAATGIALDSIPEEPVAPTPIRKLRLGFAKKGHARWLSQLDLQRVMIQGFRRAEIPLAPSKGFNPRPQLSFAMALPVGTECLSEWVDVDIRDDETVVNLPEPQLLSRLNGVAAPGVVYHSAHWIDSRSPNLATSCSRVEAVVRLIPETPDLEAMVSLIEEGLTRFREEGALHYDRPKRGKNDGKRVDLSPFIVSAQIEREKASPCLRLTLAVQEGRSCRPDEVALALAGGGLDPVYLDVERTALVLEEVAAV